MTVNLEQAKSDLSQLIDQALHGESILILRDGKLPVKIEAAEVAVASSAPRTLGFLQGKYPVPADIKGPFREAIEDMFGLQD